MLEQTVLLDASVLYSAPLRALHAGADIILTFNLKHFPDSVFAGQGLRAVHPDALLTDLLQAASEQMIEAIAKQRLRLRNPPKVPPSTWKRYPSSGY